MAQLLLYNYLAIFETFNYNFCYEYSGFIWQKSCEYLYTMNRENAKQSFRVRNKPVIGKS